MTQLIGTFPKQPGEIRDYDIVFADRLANYVDTVASPTSSNHGVTVPAGITLDDSEVTAAGDVKVWLSGGTDQTDYDITGWVMTAGGRKWYGDIRIQVRD